MGEFFEAYNHTKREHYNNHACGGCIKFSENMGGRAGVALWYLMHKRSVDGSEIVGRWAGDNVEIIGDNDDEPRGYADIGEIVNDWLNDHGMNAGTYEGIDCDADDNQIPLKFPGRQPRGGRN